MPPRLNLRDDVRLLAWEIRHLLEVYRIRYSTLVFERCEYGNCGVAWLLRE